MSEAKPLAPICFRLNGEAVTISTPPARRLLQILREDRLLAGAKPGCGVGRCGACVVWLDGDPVNACLLMAWQVDGREVTTAEHLVDMPAAEVVRAALAECGAVQCGYCSAGLVMSLTHLHGRDPRPDAAQVRELMSAHLCRCTGYGGIGRAIDRLFGATVESGTSIACGAHADSTVSQSFSHCKEQLR